MAGAYVYGKSLYVWKAGADLGDVRWVRTNPPSRPTINN